MDIVRFENSDVDWLEAIANVCLEPLHYACGRIIVTYTTGGQGEIDPKLWLITRLALGAIALIIAPITLFGLIVQSLSTSHHVKLQSWELSRQPPSAVSADNSNAYEVSIIQSHLVRYENGNCGLDLSGQGLNDQALQKLWPTIEGIEEKYGVRLTYLDLSNNWLRNIPQEIEQLTNLRILDVSLNRITEIPAAIGGLTKLEELDVSHNAITEIPAAIGGLTKLEELDVSHNGITKIPAVIGGLTNLQKLNMSANHIREIPAVIGGLTKLEELDVSSNNITVISEAISGLTCLEELIMTHNNITEIPAAIGGLTKLKELDLSSNNITVIPEAISGLTCLEELIMTHNNITEIPAAIVRLSNLQKLNMSANHIREIPEAIVALTHLQHLSLGLNNIETVPESIYTLSSQVTIHLLMNGLSNEIVDAIEGRQRAEGYNGPVIQCSLPNRNRGNAIITNHVVEHKLKELYGIAKGTYTVPSNLLTTEGNKATLFLWLERLYETADFKSNKHQQQAAIAACSYIELANTNESYREAFFVEIEGATASCGDRMALSTIWLGIRYEESKLDLNNVQVLADWLKKTWIIDLLIKQAKQKIQEIQADQNNVDPIEVYLVYLLHFKDKHQLPIAAENMLYRVCSRVTDDDLKEAERVIQEAITNKDRLHQYLIQDDRWGQALTNRFKDAYTKIVDTVTSKYTGGDLQDESTLAQVNQAINAQKIDLSKKLLSESADIISN